jgi:4-hydroxyacetophenone monooxygenase
MPVNAAALPITVDDDAIRAAVEDAELPALLVALAHVTGDTRLIATDLRAPLRAMPTGVEPQGGMSPDAQARAKLLATETIIRYRDAGCPAPGDLSAERLQELLEFICGDAAVRYMPLLLHELGIPSDRGAPAWHKNTVAPDEPFSVIVVGAGMSGLVMAHRLAQAGIQFTVVEKNPEVGGTWWENSYPGCRLDTSNFAYSYSFAQKDDWPSHYSPQGAILDYFREVTQLLSLRPHIQFNVEAKVATYDPNRRRWTLEVEDASGEQRSLEANAVILAVGQLNRPKLPDISGRDSFRGTSFHSAQWREDIDLRGARVGVIGTGASAFQIIPAIAEDVAQLTVYQRTPAWMLPAPNYHKPLASGLMWLFRHIPYYHRWFRFYQFWVSSENRLPFFTVDPSWPAGPSVGHENEQLRQALYNHLAPQYADRPDLLTKVIPDYPPGAKRMLRDNGVWAATLHRDNVELVTTPIAQIAPDSVRTADGIDRKADVLIYATGFYASDFYGPIRIHGADGRELDRVWDGDARTYLGGCVPGFPNLFSLFGPNTALVINGSIFFMSECASNYILECLRIMLERRAHEMECLPEAYERYCAEVDAGNRQRAWGGVSLVNSWYRNKFGRASQAWPFPLAEFWERTRCPDTAAFRFG